MVRPARASDAGAWERMRERLWPSDPGRHAGEIAGYFSGALREPLEVLLALDDLGEAIGFVELSIRAYAEGCETDRVAFVEGWYVDDVARGKGVGAALVGASEEWARSQGCTELASAAELENAASAEAHRAVGFTEVGIVRCFRKSV